MPHPDKKPPLFRVSRDDPPEWTGWLAFAFFGLVILVGVQFVLGMCWMMVRALYMAIFDG